ncbi:hypothetical protein Dimus_008032 [Dionaea muscipula]
MKLSMFHVHCADSAVIYSKATGRVKELISNLPVATEEDDVVEAAALQDETEMVDRDGDKNDHPSSAASSEGNAKVESDPFGLDALLGGSKQDEKTKANRMTIDRDTEDEEEDSKQFLKLQREALINCLEIAANRYRTPWSVSVLLGAYFGFCSCCLTLHLSTCDGAYLYVENLFTPTSRCQTVIDILAKHAFDNISWFTARQIDVIERLWTSIREQQARRKQGKMVSSKLDVNGFEWLRQKYANEKISIRHAVGGSGDRRCKQ